MKAISLSICSGVGVGMACAALGATFTFGPAVGTGSGTTSPGVYAGTGSGTWSTPIETSAGDPYIDFMFDTLSDTASKIYVSASFTGTTKVTADELASGQTSGNFWVEFPHIQFRLERYDNNGDPVLPDLYHDYGPTAVTSPTVSLAQGQTSGDLSISWSGNFVFDAASPGYFRLYWNMSNPEPKWDSAGKQGSAGNTTYAISGTISTVPETEEYALIASLGLLGLAGWRRARRQ